MPNEIFSDKQPPASDKLPPASASGQLEHQIGFSQMSEKKSIILSPLAQSEAKAERKLSKEGAARSRLSVAHLVGAAKAGGN